MRMLSFVSLLAFAGAVCGQTAEQPRPGAATAAPVRPLTEDEKAIHALIEAFVKAFNAGDAKTVAALHTPDAHMIDLAGVVVEGRAAIEREYAGLFHDNPGLQVAIHPQSLRRIGPDTVIEDGQSTLTARGSAPVVNRYTVVYAKRDGRWLHASSREYPGPLPGAHARLAELEWMLGEWIDEAHDSIIHSSCRWSDDKTALVRDFTIQRHGAKAMSGTQRIGWDPRAGQIKSWEFDSEGGNGESLWARYANHWTVKATGVLQDGRTATATHIITHESNDSCRWRTVDRTIGSSALPDAVEFVMVRKPPKPNAH